MTGDHRSIADAMLAATLKAGRREARMLECLLEATALVYGLDDLELHERDDGVGLKIITVRWRGKTVLYFGTPIWLGGACDDAG